MEVGPSQLCRSMLEAGALLFAAARGGCAGLGSPLRLYRKAPSTKNPKTFGGTSGPLQAKGQAGWGMGQRRMPPKQG